LEGIISNLFNCLSNTPATASLTGCEDTLGCSRTNVNIVVTITFVADFHETTPASFVTFIALYVVNQQYVMTLFHDPLGVKFLTAAIVSIGIGIFIMKRMVSIKV